MGIPTLLIKGMYLILSIIRNWIILLVDQIKKVLFSMNNAASKVLVLDCDNTLWGGVVGEDGTYGIKIGSDGEGLIAKIFKKK